MAGLGERHHAHDARHGPAAQRGDVGEFHGALQAALFVVVILAQRQQVGLADHEIYAAPERDRLRLGREPDIMQRRVGFLGGEKFPAVVVHQCALLHQVVVGEVRAHPRAHHHRRRHLHHLVDLGKVVPHLAAFAQGGGAGVAGRGLDADKGLVQALGPEIHGQGAAPVGGDHLHLYTRPGAGAAVEPVHLLQQRPHLGGALRRRGGRRGGRQQQG